MPSYMLQLTYTQEMIKAAIANPKDRTQHISKVIENLGGTMQGIWFCLGDYDVVTIYDLPDNEAAAALSLAISGGGAVREIKTTPLLSVAEAFSAMYKAHDCGYAPMKIDKQG
ncbi:MAG: GYD domain-containing protein [Acidobacteriaceae bacterium]